MPTGTEGAIADLRISELAALAGIDLAASDLLAVADVSASESKKITVTDFIGNAVTLIADATIPNAKILFNSASVPGSALAAGAVDTAQLADNGVSAAKLGNESTVDLVTTLPAAGAYIGQLALDTDDDKVYCWDGSSWVTIKAAGSVNTIVGDTAGIVNISIAASGDTVTISTSLDNTSGAAQFLAGPTANAGAVNYRQIASGDLPTAGSGGKGAVVVNGEGLAISGDQLVIDNTVAASGSTYSVVQYSTKGIITDGRAITSADLPEATAVDKGAVTPGTGLAVAAGGALDHSNAVVAGTATKVSFDAQGHVTAVQSLLDTDIPNLPAGKLTSGTLSSSVIGTKSITGDKLADSSTVQFGGAGSTSGIVTFPTADFQGQLFFDALNDDLYIYDGSAWQPITITAGELIYAGTYDASVNEVKSVTAAGSSAGLVVGAALPPASDGNLRYYLVVSDSGTGTAPAPAVALAPPDMIVSGGTTWELIDVSNAIAGQIASNISLTPTGDISSTNVQSAIEELDTEKLAKAGGTVTGNLEIGSTGSLSWEGSTADTYETTLAVVDPTADRTITLPDVTGTVITSGDSGTVTSTMIADGTIVNADINASAAIVDTKLATIATAGKVSNSATTAASANTASAIVARDGSGNFSAGTITADLTGTASAIADNIVTSAKIVDGTIINADINATAEIAVSKLADGAARQLLQTDAAGTGVEWTDNVDVPGTLDVTGAAVFDSNLTLNAQSDLRFADSDSSNWVAFQAPATVAADVTWTLPAADGTSGQVLSTDGSGALSWASGGGEKIEVGNTSAEVIDTGSDGRFVVTTEGSERARITSDGKLLVGTTSANGSQVEAKTAAVASGDSAYAKKAYIANIPYSTTNVTSSILAGYDDNVHGVNIGYAYDGTGYYLAFATNNATTGSPTERMRITNGGATLVGKTVTALGTAGHTLFADGLAYHTSASQPPLFVNRLTDDGELVRFYQADVQEGGISVSGTTVSYIGAHLSRWSQLPGNAVQEEILRGTVLSNIDEMCSWGEEDNEQLNRMQVSDVEGDPNVSGVFQSWDDDDDTYTDDFYCAMTGDFIIRIAEGVTVQRGDLLMSAGDGTAKPQGDGFVQDKTIAKVTSNHVTCIYDDGSYCVPCVLMAC